MSDLIARLAQLNDGETLTIPAGIHRLPHSIRLSGRHIRLLGEDGAVLQCTVPLPAEQWTAEENGVFSAPFSETADLLLIGGHPYTMARYPKQTDPALPYGGYAADCISPEKTKDWAHPAGGYLHAMHCSLWGGYSYRINGKNPDGTLCLEGGWQNNRPMGMHEAFRYVENIREELTEPGEWVYDTEQKRIFVRLLPGDSLDNAEVSCSSSFLLLDGCEDVSIENLTFAYSARTFMQTKEPLLRSDWTIYRGGALTFRNCHACTIDRCTFEHIGSNAIFADGNNSGLAITRSRFTQIGASGICFVGRPDCVRNPLFAYEQTQTRDSLDHTPGPCSDSYPRFCTVEDCLIDHTGTTEKQASGVEISMALGITLRNCTICHTPRAGINISEGTFGGHRIEGCDVFDTVRETGDHGSFNSWGRDRFWHVPDLPDTEAGRYALLDCIAPVTLTRNRFRCDHGWDIDLDDGSSHYIITENLCLHGGLKLREGFFRTVRRNITIDNTLHLHVWYPDSGDLLEENLVCRAYAPIGMPPVWGHTVNRNFLHEPSGTVHPAVVLQQASGQDSDSAALDVQFRSPETGDFRPVHPLLEPLFRDFPTEFGVRYAPLRAVADTPDLPPLEQAAEPGKPAENRHFPEGFSAKNIDTDDEMSVYATAGHRGALVTSVQPGSAAARRGLLERDVIVAAGETPVHSVQDLAAVEHPCAGSLQILRKQLRMTLGQ